LLFVRGVCAVLEPDQVSAHVLSQGSGELRRRRRVVPALKDGGWHSDAEWSCEQIEALKRGKPAIQSCAHTPKRIDLLAQGVVRRSQQVRYGAPQQRAEALPAMDATEARQPFDARHDAPGIDVRRLADLPKSPERALVTTALRFRQGEAV